MRLNPLVTSYLKKKKIRRHLKRRSDFNAMRFIQPKPEEKRAWAEYLRKRRNGPENDGYRARIIHPVVSIDSNGQTKVHATLLNAARATGAHPSAVCKCLKGKRPRANGFNFIYLSVMQEAEKRFNMGTTRAVKCH